MRGLIMAAQQQANQISTGIRPNYIYGLLYNWEALIDQRLSNGGFVPPTRNIYVELNNYIDTNYNVAPNDFGVGNHMKSCRQVNSPLGGDCATSVHPRWEHDGAEYGRNTLRLGFHPNGLRRGDTGASVLTGAGHYGWHTEGVVGRGIRLLYSTSALFINLSMPGTTNAGCSIRLQRLATAEELLITEGQIIPDYYKGNNDFLYDCVRINDRIWTVQNLAETKWNDGTAIPFEGANAGYYTNEEWGALTGPAQCSYDNDTNKWAYTL